MVRYRIILYSINVDIIRKKVGIEMELDIAIKSRRSCRDFKEDSVSMEDVFKIIEAGIWAPNSGGSQPWKFKIVNEQQEIERLYELITECRIINKRKTSPDLSEEEIRINFQEYIAGIRKAPIQIICFMDEQQIADKLFDGNLDDYKKDTVYGKTYKSSVDLAVENMMLKATELGLGSLYFVTGVLNEEKIREFFELRETLIPVTMLPIGYANSLGEGKERKIEEFLI